MKTDNYVSIDLPTPSRARVDVYGTVPEPDPVVGMHTFPTKDQFPPPRPFVKGARMFASGGKKGSGFDLSVL